MKKHILLFTLAAGIAISLPSCHGKRLRGEGSKITSARTITAFTALQIGADMKAIITVQPGAQPTLILKGYENLLSHIKTKTDSNKLEIYTDLESGWSLDNRDGTTAEIIVPSLSALELNGATNADIHGSLTGNDFKVSLSGAGKLMIDSLNVTNFSTDVSGAADIEIKAGTVQKAAYEISGAGKIEAFPLQAAEVTTSISGAAKADITAIKTLNVNINGAGKIKYKGHPVITKDISGAGSVRDVN